MDKLVTMDAVGIRSILINPSVWLALALPLIALLLMLPITVPIGPMSWDTYIYLDAAHRIAEGQLHSVDFSAPVGPLGYYLFAWGFGLFPNAHPLLLAQFCVFVVTAPLMALAVSSIWRQRPLLAAALVLPFLLLALAPSNSLFYSTLPGLDGFGIYNRHASTLLYALVAGVLFLPSGRRLAILCAGAMLALFLTKITGFLVGGLLGLLAMLSGRLKVSHAVMAGVVFAVPLVVLEVSTGMVGAYLRDIGILAFGGSEESTQSRVLLVLARKIDVLVPLALLVVLVFIMERRDRERPSFLDSSAVWLCVVALGATIFETQNTGSQEYAFLWPVVVLAFLRVPEGLWRGHARTAFLVVAALTILPTFSTIAFKTVRGVGSSILYDPIEAPLLRNMERYSGRHDMMIRADLMLEQYATHRDAYDDMLEHGFMPTAQLYLDIDFQIFWLLSANQAVAALLEYEEANGMKLETLATLDFTDPFPWLLDRTPVKYLQIGATPGRTLVHFEGRAHDALAEADAVLRPICAQTPGQSGVEEFYRSSLEGRHTVALAPCWELLLRADLAPQN